MPCHHWKEAIGQDGVGGDNFLSGSISTALRNFYQGLVGQGFAFRRDDFQGKRGPKHRLKILARRIS
jgi:hypothetical protein